jgi:peptide/nickel transport system ATP-binding protein/oligopeptide transport system ATP-binding protein
MAEVAPILEVIDLVKHFAVGGGLFRRRQGWVFAVDGISFSVFPGETLGLVGESGCGKSTAARLIVKLIEPTSGAIRLEGRDITALPPQAMRQYRKAIQFIFQDPYSSLNPRLAAGEIVAEPLHNYPQAPGRRHEERVAQLFARVGLRPEHTKKYPHEFSGGQRQRLGIARALALEPRLIIADEPVSALDVSVQAQVINLMADLQSELGLSYLFIAHDLAVVQHISHRVAVMYLGRIVELARTRDLFMSPQHPYTEALLDAVPVPDPDRPRPAEVLTGEVPSPMRPPPGCHFHTRCPYAVDRCRIEVPRLREVRPGHFAACHLRPPMSAAHAA